MAESDYDDDREDQPETLRRLIRNTERLSRGPATPQHDAIERQFQRFQALTRPLDDMAAEPAGYETGEEDVVIEGWETRRVRRGERAALLGRHFFGVRGLLIGGAPVDDLVVVNSRRLEFTVPSEATSNDVIVLYEHSGRRPREPELELGAPRIERPD
jgi:hypothetical protein